MINIDPQTYRFKFSEPVVGELARFGNENQQLGRKLFQKEWRSWLEKNKKLVDEESNRLRAIGFRGEPVDKMYKSVRYYFSKNGQDKKSEKSEKTENKSVRRYCSLDKNVLDAIDKDLQMRMEGNDFTPASGYTAFCNDNQELLLRAISALVAKGVTDSNEISAKVKKAYKNRYFVLSRK